MNRVNAVTANEKEIGPFQMTCPDAGYIAALFEKAEPTELHKRLAAEFRNIADDLFEADNTAREQALEKLDEDAAFQSMDEAVEKLECSTMAFHLPTFEANAILELAGDASNSVVTAIRASVAKA